MSTFSDRLHELNSKGMIASATTQTATGTRASSPALLGFSFECGCDDMSYLGCLPHNAVDVPSDHSTRASVRHQHQPGKSPNLVTDTDQRQVEVSCLSFMCSSFCFACSLQLKQGTQRVQMDFNGKRAALNVSKQFVS